MSNVIIGTAGHVDHGKTSLIKALTGTDTDRLSEEKKRGITIELGFTEMPNDRGLNIGIIDVPGHEKFVKNMLAGIGGIDLVMLIVDATEGIMPQTTEHFQILKSLCIKKGITVVTKADLVDEEWMELVKEDISEYLKGTFMEDAPIIDVSSYTGHNIGDLKTLICDSVSNIVSRNESPNLLRLPIDRVFTMTGFGTVITGTLIEGMCSVGDELQIYPEGKSAKIRNIQVHGVPSEHAYAGQRTAINLLNVKKEEINRGDVIAFPNSLNQTNMLSVKISMFTDSPRALSNASRVHLYYGSAEVLCKVVLLDSEVLESGKEGYAQLRLESPIAVKKGDRFIIRFYSPAISIGGGVILDANPDKQKRFDEKTLSALRIKESGNSSEILAQTILEQSRKIVPIKDIFLKLGYSESEFEQQLLSLCEDGTAIEIVSGIYVHRDFISEIAKRSSAILTDYHANNPISQGIAKEEYKSKVMKGISTDDEKVLESLFNTLVEHNAIKLKQGVVSNPDFSVTYTQRQLAIKDEILKKFISTGIEFPELETVLAEYKDKVTVRHIIDDLVSEGNLMSLSSQQIIATESWNKALVILKEHMSKNNSITLAEFRDMLGTSRKYAVSILESFDRKKITQLVDDVRILA